MGEDFLLDDDGTPLMPGDPRLAQRLLSANVRDPQAASTQPPGFNMGLIKPQPSPNMSMAPGAGGAPQPATPAAPNGPTSAQLLQQMYDRMGKQPDAAEMIAQAKKREEGANRKTLLALTLGAMGGESFKPFAAMMGQQATKESEPYEIPGGWGTATGEGVVWNPAKQNESELARLQALYGIQEKTEAAKALEQGRREDRRSAQQDKWDMFNMSLADRQSARASSSGDRAENRDARQEQQRWRNEDQMRNHFDQVTKDTREVLNMGRALATLPVDGKLTPIQKQSLVIMLNKFQDPGSVVREGEFNRVAEAQGLLQRWGNLPEKIQTGSPLPPALVRDIQAALKLYTTAAENTMRDTAQSYLGNARQRGLDPTQIVTDPRWHPQQAAPAPGAGGGRGSQNAPIKVSPKSSGKGGDVKWQGVIESDL